MRRYIISLLACFLLLFVLQTIATACCDPPCGDCESCVDEECVDNCDPADCCGGSCCANECCNDVCCGEGESCIDDECEVCEGDTSKICCDDLGDVGVYYCCHGGTECCKTDCCKPQYEYCLVNQCRCKNCYEDEFFPPNYVPGCPACDNAQGGCYSDFIWIQYGYDYWTGFAPGEGEVGWCDNPTKQKEVGYHMFCTDYDADVDAIVDLLELLGDLPTYADCGKCVLTKNPVTCLKCLASLVLDGLIDLEDYPCIFVNECQMCHSVDVECSTPHEETVVDWEVMTGVVPSCIPGINYP